MDWQLTYRPDRFFKDICCDKASQNENCFIYKSKSTPKSEKCYFIMEFFESKPNLNDEEIEKFVNSMIKFTCPLIKTSWKFNNGLLFKNMFNKCMYPCVNLVIFEHDDDQYQSVGLEWRQYSEKCLKFITESNSKPIYGGYEIYESIKLHKDIPNIFSKFSIFKENPVIFLISTYRVSGNLQWLEQNWRNWTGITTMLRYFDYSGGNLRKNVSRITFFRQVSSVSNFLFLLIVEIQTNLECKESYRIKDLLKYMNERNSGHTEAFNIHYIY